ncbi:DUF2637 domain-containing protein [Amycolatopsis pithecellobii]|uniref:DUF2637 domain-containing protein n=1 Tax=Amycolatopsis pithecellobii TaxID=664692 RepID=A0A6N7Z2A1_9PSEU|nr:DUF2637 domain-containing protein [Amycolatopsis pithecellobii]MTD53884.1 DUF2637 domain-containing protein [Amycolatopsis pithecellobii]
MDSSGMADVIRMLVTVVLGGIGGAAGFTHTHDWAVHHGQTGWIAWADAVVIEGIAIVAGFEVQRDHRRRTGRTLTFPMLVLVAGFGIQMTAQVALAEPTPSGWLLAAMPALGFLVVVKLLLRRTPSEHEQKSTETPTAATPEPRPEPAPPDAAAETTQVLPRLKLPASMAERIHTATAKARQEGREITPADIQAVVKVPGDLAARIVADLTTANGHTVTA